MVPALQAAGGPQLKLPAAQAEWRNILNSSQLNHGPQLSHPPLIDQSEALPVLVDDDALAVLGVEAAGHPHVQLEARSSHVHHRPAQHVAVLGRERQRQVGSDCKFILGS